MRRRTNEEAALALPILLDTLSSTWSIHLVLHFEKIRSAPPHDLNVTPLFPLLQQTDQATSLPVVCPWKMFPSNPDLLGILPRLGSADALLAFLGKSDKAAKQQIVRMSQIGLDGFSEEGGLLCMCWPSSLSTILQAKGVSAGAQLFGDDIAGVLMVSPFDRQVLVGIANQELREQLSETTFEESDGILS